MLAHDTRKFCLSEATGTTKKTKNKSVRYTYARARLRKTRMARGKKTVRAAQKKQCEKPTRVPVSTQQHSKDEAHSEKSKRGRKTREHRKQLFRKERVRAQNRLTKECVAQAYTSDGDVSPVDVLPIADDTVFSAREHEEYVKVSVEDDEGWQEQRRSRTRVYDACVWADACLENVCTGSGSGESCTSDVEMPEADVLGD